MRRAIFCFPLALLFLANTVPSNAQSEGDAAPATEQPEDGSRVIGDVPLELVYYDVGRNLSLRCGLANDKSVHFLWKKNGTSVDELWDVKGRYALEEAGAVFRVTGRAHEDDYGNYTCSVEGRSQGWEVRGRPHAKLPANSNVVEGQTLKLQCRVTGKPYPRVAWTYTNSSDEDVPMNGTPVTAALGDRVKLQRSEQGIEDGELVVEAAQRSDAGRFACVVAGAPVGPAGLTVAVTTLRVKDMYAALWPFLGICAEVFILCAIILVYEKRRTKPELDDSDTDNHDQKKS